MSDSSVWETSADPVAEARIPLAQAAIYVASAPKSNAAYVAMNEALEWVEHHKTEPIPSYLQDAHYPGAAKLGHGIGYKYAHDYDNHWVKQQYLPDDLKNRQYYHFGENKTEQAALEYKNKIQK